jgi:hydrogenase maturation protease
LKILLLAIGNVYRRDDGVAHHVLELLRAGQLGVTSRSVLQLTPEMAEEIAPFEQVVFIDADLEPGEPRLEPTKAERQAGSAVAHALSPEVLLALAERLYGFRGQGWLCRIPGEDFSEGTGLSDMAAMNAAIASRLLMSFVQEERSHC